MEFSHNLLEMCEFIQPPTWLALALVRCMKACVVWGDRANIKSIEDATTKQQGRMVYNIHEYFRTGKIIQIIN